jgi:rod shape-determining protein MreD
MAPRKSVERWNRATDLRLPSTCLPAFMRQLKIAIVIVLALVIQTSLRAISGPVGKYSIFIDLPLVVVVYFALLRDPIEAVVVGFICGLAMDVMGGGLLGAFAFSKTLVAFLVVTVTTRVLLLDNPLVRIPVLAGATLVDAAVYVGWHFLLGQRTPQPFVVMVTMKVIGTTIVGTALLYMLERLFSDRAKQRKQFASRRKVARRNMARIGRRR